MSAQGSSWDAMLKMTKIELIPDPDFYTFFEKGTRGGISERYSKPNNKYSKYDIMIQENNRNILYTQTRITYGYVMSKFLPTSGFKWTEPK